ncbi:YscQ/HrcQ family type III secretion apparatus protein [Opitutaceae bacterium EW11]|nr:YscQ/HrcQ family type III secretion apparatus protein [Opitutaceae bacterium EW11]
MNETEAATLESPEPLRFASLTEGEVSRMNALVGTRREFAFPWAGKQARLRFAPLDGAPSPSGWLRVRLGDRSFDLGLPRLPEPSSLGAAFAGIEIEQLPEPLLLGVLEAWLQDPLAALKRQSLELQLEAWQTAEPASGAALGWEIARGEDNTFLAGTLHGDTDALNHLADLAARAKPLPSGPADTLPLALSVALARVSFSLSALGEVAPGDLLFLPLLRAGAPRAEFELCLGERRVARAVKDGSVFKISAMNSSTEAKPAAAGTAPLRVDELPVQVVFDVGQLELTVGQLRTIGAGYTFELPSRPEKLVTLRANGREIGQGELVEFGDKVGVRVVHWSLA